MSKFARSTIGFLTLAVSCCSAPAPSASTARLIGSIEAGFDSFVEKYSIVEKDTLDEITEFSTRISLGYSRGSFLHDYFRIEGLAILGNEIYEGGGRLGVSTFKGHTRLAIEAEGSTRKFRSNSSYAFPNDHLRYNLRAYIQRPIAQGISVRLSDRLERVDFDQMTEFDYDYWKNSISLCADFEKSLTTLFHVGFGYINKLIPDSTEISYVAYTSHLEFRRYMGLYKQISLFLNGERRLYAHKPFKSPYWAVASEFVAQPFVFGNSLGIMLENSAESYIYDTNSGIYFTYLENKTSLLLSWQRFPDLVIRAGPRYAFFVCDFSREDRYREIGGRFSIDYNRGTRWWLSLNYEPGGRFYETFDEADEESVFSDYVFNRLFLFSTIKIWKRMNINGFLNYEPEKHKRESDDSRTTLLSLSLTYDF